MPNKRKRKLTKLKITEISAVPSPAQEGAKVVLMKHNDVADKPEKVEKTASALTSEENGHQHGVYLNVYDNEVNLRIDYATAEGASEGHGHAVARDDNGNFVVGVSDGHTHTIDVSAILADLVGDITTKTSDGDEPMTGKVEKTDAEKRLEKLEESNKRLASIVSLSADHRTHFDTLKSEGDQDAFLAKDAGARDEEIERVTKAANEEDPVAYTTLDGLAIRKSAGETVVALAKSNDKLRKDNIALIKAREEEVLEKRADKELSNVTGSTAARVALLKAVDGIEDAETRTQVTAILKAANDTATAAFQTLGAGGQVEPGSPQDRMEKMVKERMEKHDESEAVATAALMKTSEYRDLYKQAYLPSVTH